MTILWIFVLIYGVYGAPYLKSKFRHDLGSIIGGSFATAGEFPYTLSIQDISFGFHFHFCGATIYNELWSISAAQCFQGENSEDPSYLIAVAGELNTDVPEGNEQMISLSTFIQHEDFNGFIYNHDIALLKLSEPLVLNDFVQPIVLPSKNHSATGDCVLSGWGTVAEGGQVSRDLLKANVSVISYQECYLIYGDRLKDTMMCAGVPEGGVDACTGDTGGPLVCSDIGSPYLAGIVSWGYGCGRPNTPKIYTDVAQYIDWIESHAV